MEVPTNDVQFIKFRLEKLEKENRRLRMNFLIVGLTITSVLVAGASKPNTVKAQKFVLTNTKGEVRAELLTLDEDYPKLILHSPDGTKTTELNPIGISVTDTMVPNKLALAHLGSTGVYLANERGKVVVELGGASTSIPQLAPMPEIKIFNDKGIAWQAP